MRHPLDVWRTNWIKDLLILTGLCAVIIRLDTAGDIVDATLNRLADTVPATRHQRRHRAVGRGRQPDPLLDRLCAGGQ
ncbi:hypothetical protein ACYCCF_30820 [Streptomyces argenteolus]|uniref:hypothetical protein n=1 Tax=Streptomyces sp. NPDC025273 TaxID=3155251 RepID=UPI0033E1D640